LGVRAANTSRIGPPVSSLAWKGKGRTPDLETQHTPQTASRADDDEPELIARALAGDANEFARLCDRHRRRVWRIVASAVEKADVDDLAQEAIVRAFCCLHTYRAEAPFVSWLCRIALNVAHDHQRSAWKRRVQLWPPSWLPGGGGESPDAVSPEREADQRDLQRRVRAAVADLPARERVPVWLVYFEEFSLAEVARLEGVPESTLRSRVRAGLKRLERTLPADLREGGSAAEAADEPPAACRPPSSFVKGCS